MMHGTLRNAHVLTRRLTDFEPVGLDSDRVADLYDHVFEQYAIGRSGPFLWSWISPTESTPSSPCNKNSMVTWRWCAEDEAGSKTFVTSGDRLMTSHEYPFISRTRATTSSATTVSVLGELLRRRARDDRLERMAPERRAAYERIRKLREEIGPVKVNVVEALRELRADG